MILDTIEYKGYEIQIDHDQDSADPRDWSNLGTMVCWHDKYKLGDKHDFDTPQDFQEYAEESDLITLPLYLYDHSGITMNVGGFSCPWDSGQVGYIYVSKQAVRKEYDWKRLTAKRLAEIHKYLTGEVETYDHYIAGRCYGYIVEKDDEVLDSCCGFLGYPEESGLMQEAKDCIDWRIKKQRTDHFEQLKAWIRNGVGLEHRTPAPKELTA